MPSATNLSSLWALRSVVPRTRESKLCLSHAAIELLVRFGKLRGKVETNVGSCTAIASEAGQCRDLLLTRLRERTGRLVVLAGAPSTSCQLKRKDIPKSVTVSLQWIWLVLLSGPGGPGVAWTISILSESDFGYLTPINTVEPTLWAIRGIRVPGRYRSRMSSCPRSRLSLNAGRFRMASES